MKFETHKVIWALVALSVVWFGAAMLKPANAAEVSLKHVQQDYDSDLDADGIELSIDLANDSYEAGISLLDVEGQGTFENTGTYVDTWTLEDNTATAYIGAKVENNISAGLQVRRNDHAYANPYSFGNYAGVVVAGNTDTDVDAYVAWSNDIIRAQLATDGTINFDFNADINENASFHIGFEQRDFEYDWAHLDSYLDVETGSDEDEIETISAGLSLKF